jgi:hypothetical protein
LSGAETKYAEVKSAEKTTLNQSSSSPVDGSLLNENIVRTDWERDHHEGRFELSKNTYQYRRLQPQRARTSLGEATVKDGDVVYRRTDGYKHSTVLGDEVKQSENPYMPGINTQPLLPPTFIQQNMLRHGKVHNVFTREQYEKDPFLRLHDRVRNLQYWKKPPIHTKVFRRKFSAKKFLVDIPGIYDKK